ncbi:MAG: AAA family ATPase [Crocinitomicaceae bacterium]|nr:AAA family ATPase [Crocinitomicaceae bacterium]
MVISVGQRYCLGIFSKDKNRNFIVLSKDPISDKLEEFDRDSNEAYLNYLQEWKITDVQKQNIHEGISRELARTNRSGYRKHNKEDFEEYAYNLTVELNSMKALNTILYGPPGTGKTYHLKNDLFPLYTINRSSITREQFLEDFIKDIPWWKVIALVVDKAKKMTVREIYDHEFIRAKVATSNSKTVRPTIWGQLQAHTVMNCENVGVKSRQTPLIFYKNEDSSWQFDTEGLEQMAGDIQDLIHEIDNFEQKEDISIKRYEFVTFHQSYGYEDFIEGIKPVMEEESDGDLRYEIKDGIFKRLCLRAENDPENSYAIFIDEINRGNVSSIFGELITLIEDDKRIGAGNEMKATLPYSRTSFGVPKNVYIYGTMNTADRSVESLDTALRRRFSFVEMLPDTTLLTEEIEGISLKSLLELINQRIEVLVDRDHTIGHAYFMNILSINDLRNTFANKVIPLLQEYFYGDYSKMEMVIGSAFFSVKDISKVKFAVKANDFDPEGKVYHILNIADESVMTDKDFITALNTLIKGQA